MSSGTLGVISSRAILSSPSAGSYAPCGSCRTTSRCRSTAFFAVFGIQNWKILSVIWALIPILNGVFLDVAVDIRRGSPTFGRHVSVELSGDNKRQFFVPRGFAHGFSVLSDEAVFQYKCDNLYAPESEGAIAWDDPTLGIDWRLAPGDVVLSPKDSGHPRLEEAAELFDYNTDYYA